MKSALRFLVVLVILMPLSYGLVLAGFGEGTMVFGLPVLLLAALLAYVIQWVAFVPAFLFKTEKFYDLTGSLTYISVVAGTFYLSASQDLRSLLIMLCILIWAIRLGSFLFARILADGKDSRFDDIKGNPWRFATAWTIQGAWVFITTCCALAAITTTSPVEMGWIGWFGLAVWATGFAIETIADNQKKRFKASPDNADKFIQQGLWRYSRHPNYFGEIVLWTGIAIMAVPTLGGWQWLTLISPLFVILLLTKVSGIPLLEAKSDKRWGENPEYQAYKARTSVLIPTPVSD